MGRRVRGSTRAQVRDRGVWEGLDAPTNRFEGLWYAGFKGKEGEAAGRMRAQGRLPGFVMTVGDGRARRTKKIRKLMTNSSILS